MTDILNEFGKAAEGITILAVILSLFVGLPFFVVRMFYRLSRYSLRIGAILGLIILVIFWEVSNIFLAASNLTWFGDIFYIYFLGIFIGIGISIIYAMGQRENGDCNYYSKVPSNFGADFLYFILAVVPFFFYGVMTLLNYNYVGVWAVIDYVLLIWGIIGILIGTLLEVIEMIANSEYKKGLHKSVPS